MSVEAWTTVGAKKKRDTRHYIRTHEADEVEKKLNIIGLSRALLSKESRALQDEGWKYERVIRGNDARDQNLDTDYDFMRRMPIEGNPYGDEVLFMMPVERK
jgi:hypothetical protein